MICPHCSAELLRRQRHGQKCSRCRRPFALEPKDNTLHLHDLRMRRLAAWLSDPDTPGAPPLAYSADQLRFAASRRILTAGPSRKSGWVGCAILALVIGTVYSFGVGGPSVFVVMFFGVVIGLLVVGHVMTAKDRRYPGEPITATDFDRLVQCWVAVYGAPPPGLLSPGPVPDVWPPGPLRAVLYCTDSGIVAFLAAAGVAQRHGVVLVNPAPTWPPDTVLAALRTTPGLPVLVLHDADREGCLTVHRMRTTLEPDTLVLDAGLAPHVAAELGPPVRRTPDPDLVRRLSHTRLTADDRSWLAQGTSLPLAALRPARLLRAVERALGRLGASTDPVDPEARRAAARPGYLVPCVLPRAVFDRALTDVDDLVPARLPPLLGATDAPDVLDYGVPRVLVCQHDAIAAMLLANDLHMESATVVLGGSQDLAPLGDAAVHLLNDATAAGARWAADTESRLGRPARRLGLTASQARMLHLTRAAGGGAELAGVPPEHLLRVLRRLLAGRARPEPAGSVRGRADLGFLSWPQEHG